MNKAQSNKGVIHNRTLHLYLQKWWYPRSLLFHISYFVFCICKRLMLPSWEERWHWTDAQHSPTEQTAGSRLSSTFSSQTSNIFSILGYLTISFITFWSQTLIFWTLLSNTLTDCFQDCDPKYCYLLTFWCLTIILFKFVISPRCQNESFNLQHQDLCPITPRCDCAIIAQGAT